MNVLVLGSGGREHAICWKIKQSTKLKKLYCIPGNAGISEIAQCSDIKLDDFEALAKFVKDNNVDLTFVGPEAPLADGIVDFFEVQGLRIFGPNKISAKLEASKVFSKDLMKKYNVPTAKYGSFDRYEDAVSFLKNWPANSKVVLKADGLAQGKGVLICDTVQQAKELLSDVMVKKVFGKAGDTVVIEEFLDGEETSIMVFVDSKNYAVMVSSQDHKRVFDNDQGLNTGGMGAYAPAPVVTEEMKVKIEEKVIKPFIAGLIKEGIKYKGVLYCGLMICNNEPWVIEFNCRLGDPETQVVLPLLKTDLIEIAHNVIDERLDKSKIEWYNKTAVCVVLAAGGYPGNYEKGKEITGLEKTEAEDSVVFHAGTVKKDGKVLTNGGRVLGVVGLGEDIKKAIDTAYNAVGKIKFNKVHFRKDIGFRALNRLKK